MNNIYIYILFFLCGIFIYYIINNIDKLEVDVGDPPIIGGWCMCAYSNKPVWNQENVNTIIAGGFQGIGSIGPFGKEINISNNLSLDDTCYGKNIKNILNNYDHKWLSVGGDKVGCKGEINEMGEYITFCPKYVNTCLDNALELINKYNFNGIAFDMEGCLSLRQDVMNDINQWITTNGSGLGQNFKYVYVGGKFPSGYEIQDFSNFTYICPMLYSSDDSYNDVTPAKSKIHEYIESWTDKGWSNDKIILTYQAISAMGSRDHRNPENIKNGKEVLQYLTNLLINDKYAGLLGWPPVYDDNFQKQQTDADGCMTIINQIYNL